MSGTAWWAPGRVNLIGDHTDYSGGLVLPFAIQLGTRVEVKQRDDDVLEVSSPQLSRESHRVRTSSLTPRRTSWASYVEGALWLLRDDGVDLSGADVRIVSDLPVGAGLSSSAAVVCATLGALLDLVGETWTPQQVALGARRVENDYVGAPVGVMDPMVVMHAQDGNALLIDTRTLQHEQVPLALAQHGLDMLVVDTGAAHSNVSTAYAQRVEQCRDAAGALGVASLRDVADVADLEPLTDPILRRRARHVVTENHRVLAVAELLRQDRVADIGALLLESHASLRDDYEVSSPQLDVVVDVAADTGALGARVTGAGLGGSAVVMCRQDSSAALGAAVAGAFARRGWRAPGVWSVGPGHGAVRCGEDGTDGPC